MHSVAEKMRVLEHTAKVLIEIDPCYQRQKYSPMTPISGNDVYGYSWGFL